MTGLVEELQRKALDRNCPITDLLRHALLTARKLKVTSTAEWIASELNGYGEEDVPAYRILSGQPLAKNPYHGWVPIRLPTAELTQMISEITLGNAIADLDASIDASDGSHLYYSFPTDRAYRLREVLATDFELCLRVSKSTVASVIDQVRSKLLDWSMALEEQGVHGAGLSFSEKEVEAARGVVTYVTHNNYSNINNSQIQHHSNASSQTLTINEGNRKELQELLRRLREGVESSKFDSGFRDDLLSDLDVADRQIAAPKAKPSIVKAALESFSSTLGSGLGSAVTANAHDWAMAAQSWVGEAIKRLGQ
jgi:hypothetical protein